MRKLDPERVAELKYREHLISLALEQEREARSQIRQLLLLLVLNLAVLALILWGNP